MIKKIVILVSVLSFLCAGSSVLAAQKKYPSKNIDFIVGFAPGGGADGTARILYPSLEKALGVSVNIINRTGAGGSIGWAELARTKPDGYSIGLGVMPLMQNNTILSKTEYHSVNSFTHLGNIALDPVAIVVKTDGPYKTLNDLMEAAKKNPGKVSIGATGKGSVDYLTALSMERASGVRYAVVNLEGIEGFTAVMGGNMDAMPATISAILQYYKSNQLKVLAVATDQRHPEMPDVPTFKESKVQLLASGVYRSLIAPKGLQQDVKAILVKALKQSLDDPGFKERAAKIALPIYYLPPEETEKITKDLLSAGEKVLK